MQRLVSYNYKGERQWGVLSADGTSIYPAIDLEETYFIPLAETLGDFIESGEEGLLNLAHALEMNGKDKAVTPIALADVRLEAPFYPRRNVLCVGKNYQAHVKEFDQTANAKHPEAMKYVYGYTIINDVTARDLQKKHLQWFRGKSLDTFCPMGPTVMVGDWPLPFTIYTKVNGSLRQEGTTTDLIFSIPKLIATLSDGMTLLPGDVIATGTPQGVGMGFNPPKFLKKGDVVEINIDPIGTLRNPVK